MTETPHIIAIIPGMDEALTTRVIDVTPERITRRNPAPATVTVEIGGIRILASDIELDPDEEDCVRWTASAERLRDLIPPELVGDLLDRIDPGPHYPDGGTETVRVHIAVSSASPAIRWTVSS